MTLSCPSLLLLDDEPLILMDLELAAEDRGCVVHRATSCEGALAILAGGAVIDGAVLDYSLGKGATCEPVAHELRELTVPFVLYSGDLSSQEAGKLVPKTHWISKPAPASVVIAAIIARAGGCEPGRSLPDPTE